MPIPEQNSVELVKVYIIVDFTIWQKVGNALYTFGLFKGKNVLQMLI